MIDRVILESLDGEMMQAIKGAVEMIRASGLIELQRRNALESVLAGAWDEDPAALAVRIVELRKRQYALDAFLQLANDLETM